MKEILDYLSIRDRIDSFGVLRCEQKNWFMRLIGHTAMVYKCPLTGILFVYESTSMSYSGISGVQIHLLGDWLANYPGKVFLTRVWPDQPTGARWLRAKARLRDHIAKHRGTSYPDLSTHKGRMFLIKAAWDSWILKKASTNKDTHDFMFCTHLVADAFYDCGLIADRPAFLSSEFEPDDILEEGSFWKYLAPWVERTRELRIK